jgi:hypothetical protein
MAEIRTTQVAVQVVRTGPADTRVTQVVMPVLRSVADAAPPSSRRAIFFVING